MFPVGYLAALKYEANECLFESRWTDRIAECLIMADIVAKVPKGVAANFPPKKETSDNRRSIGLQTGYQNRL
jgi:hypothetical protein